MAAPQRLRFTSASSSSCTTHADAAKPCWAPSSPAWLRNVPATTPESNKSLEEKGGVMGRYSNASAENRIQGLAA